MAKDKMLAEWFWCDRWVGSSAFLLNIEARGLYREMLTQAWLRGARLPNDHDAIRRATGANAGEWKRCWPKVEKYWRVDGDSLVPIEDLGYAKPLPGQSDGRPYIPKVIRDAVFQKHGRACLFCGSEQRIELDHIVPFSRGGPDSVDNLQPLCKPCNLSKGAN